MSEPLSVQVLLPSDPAGKLLFHVSRIFAVAGGLILVAVTLMSVASIASRALTDKSLLGDFELVQLGCAVAVAAFLPWGQMRGSHVFVDFFTTHASRKTRSILDGIGALLLAAGAALVAWRMAVGTLDLKASSETSMLLGVPIWITYALMTPSFVLLALTGVYTAWGKFRGDAA